MLVASLTHVKATVRYIWTNLALKAGAFGNATTTADMSLRASLA
jgi:hypothetical protein